MAMKGKRKQAVGKVPASAADSSSGKRKAAASACPGGGGAKRTVRRPGVLRFFDDAAVDADLDCEEGEDLAMEEEEHEDLDDSKVEDKNLRGVGKSHQLPFFIKEEELSGDELEELIKERYSNGSGYVRYNDGSAEGDDKVSEADELKDVIIWKVKCMVGRERQVAFCLMQKYIEMHNLGAKMQIASAFSLEHFKGHVFVEADKLTDIIEACKGFCSVYSSRINVVPRSDIPNLLACRNKLSEVSTGTWVRMRSGNYKGDLAKVVAIDDGRRQATVKLVPRIDLQAIAKKFGGGVSLKLAAVPTPRLISSRELEVFRSHIELRRDRQTGELFEVLDGMMLKDGYLYKKVSIASLILWGVKPSNSELFMFSDATKDVDEDLNWVSSIYNARNKKPLTEPSDDKVSAVKKNGYGLHDLVLFGRKNFGVIVAIEKDCFKILRGDIEGAEVLPVKIREMKSACDDRMFTALDGKGKTIFIDDIVKTFVGPSEGREGSVKHMYKGTLFIQVENETENCEFFCAKSKSCEKTNESKDYHGAKSGKGKGERSSTSFLQSPKRMDDQENENDNACGSTRHCQSAYEQTFSIGQTLRIREGPLKGYLCRVVGIYRSDITVKLDSLVKLITVKEKSLAVPKMKGDSSFATRSSDHFAQDMLSAAGTSFGETSEKSPWESVVPSFDRDSWQPFSSSNSADWNNENQTGHDDDPWGNKVGSAARIGAGSGNALDDWGKQPASSTDQGHEADPWGKATGSSTDQRQAADPWSSKVTCSIGTGNGWGEQSNSCLPEKTETWEKKSHDWSKKSCDEKTTEGDEWENSKLPVSDAGGSWDMRSDKNNNASPWDSKGAGTLNSKDNPWGKAAKPQEKINDSSDGAAAGWTQPNNSWGNKGKEKVNSEEDAWRESEKLQEKDNGGAAAGWTQPNNSWGNKGKEKVNSEEDAWRKSEKLQEKDNGGAAAGWTQPNNSWGNKGKEKVNSEEDAWRKSEKLQEKDNGGAAAGWTQPHNSWGSKGEEKVNSEEDAWRKSEKLQEKNNGWNNVSEACTQSTAKLGSQDDSWDRLVSSKGNDSCWQKGIGSERVTSNDQMDNWNKPNYFESAHGVNTENKNWSQGSGWKRNQNWDQPSWKRDKEQKDEDSGRTNNGYNWSRQRDVDGDRGSCWGRGRGRHGGRGSMRFDTGEEEERWSSGRGGTKGRGRGRGHFGEARGRRNSSDEASTFCHVRNWGCESDGLTRTSDQKNQQSWGESSWTNDKNAGWNNKRSSGDDNKDAGKQSGWNSQKESGVTQLSEACDETIEGDWYKPQPDEPQINSNAWDIMGKRTVAEDACRGKTTASQEKTTGKADNWGDNSSQNKEMPILQGGNQISNWDTAVLQSSQMAKCSGQVGSWGKSSSAGNSDQWKVASQKTDTDCGGWNQAKSWDKPKSFGEDTDSDWNKIWNKTGSIGRGRGRNSGNDYNRSWNKPMDHGEGRSSWGRGRGGNDEVGGDQGSQWNRQSDFGGGRRSGWGRGRGQYRPSQRDEGDNSGGLPNQGGWRGRERGCVTGNGKIFSSGRNGDREHSGEGSFPRNSTSTWGTGDNKGWSSSWSKDNAGKESNSQKEEKLVWATESDGGMQSVWNNSSTRTEDAKKTAGTWSNPNSIDAQDAGNQGNSWNNAAGS